MRSRQANAPSTPFRALATPIVDMVRPIPYPEIYPPDDDSYHPLAIARTMFLERVDLGVAETIMGHLEASDAPMRVAQLRVLGGAMARVPTRSHGLRPPRLADHGQSRQLLRGS